MNARLLPGLLLAALSAAALAGAGPRTNIVLIVTDDQGFGDFGVMGNPVLDTPHLDALARGSATLAQFYVSPVCSPTRASLMTGRHAYRTRVVDTFEGRSMMDPDEVTLAEVLRAAGYATGLFGKWHLGDNYPLRAGDQGFEETLLLRGGGLAQPSDPLENRQRYTDPILFHNHVARPTRGYCTDLFFDAALAFIGRAGAAGRPFFVTLTPNAPHGPFHDVPPALLAKYRARDLRPVLLGNDGEADRVARIFAMIENIDANVGRLMSALRASGQFEHTLVLFCNDNGPDGRRFVGGLRGSKTEVYEGGIRSPLFAHWPARLRAGAVSDRIAAHIDVFPSVLEAAAVPLPAGLRIDGRSLLPLLEGRATDWPDRALVFQSHRGDVPQEGHHFALRTQRWKLVRPSGFARTQAAPDAPYELYDIAADPGEKHDLAAREPAVVRRLQAAYADWFRDVAATREDNFAPPRIVIGTPHKTTTELTRQNWRSPSPPGPVRTGKWLLRADRDARYALELRWPRPIAPGTLQVRAGAASVTREVPEPTATLRIEELRIPAGEFEFIADVVRGAEREGAYHAILVQQPD